MRVTITAFAASCILFAADVAAQACLRLPTQSNQATISGNAGFVDNANSFGGAFSYNSLGPVTVGAGLGVTTFDNSDENSLDASGLLGLEVPLTGLSGCVVTGLRYSTIDFNDVFSVSTLQVPIGFGIGKSIPAGPRTALVLNAVPQFLFVRSRTERTVAGDTDIDTDTEGEFGLDLGATLASSAVFGGFGVFMSTINNSDPVFTLSIGLVLGGR